MSEKERKRLAVMSRVKEGEMTIREGSEVLRVSYRQARRIHRRYLEEGDECAEQSLYYPVGENPT